MLSVTLVSILKLLSLIGSALTAAKLFQNGLYRRYPVLFAYVIFRVPNGTWAFFVDPKTSAYQQWWVVTGAIVWVFYVLLIFELYRLVLEKYKGIYTLGRRFMYLGVAVAVAISALSLLPKINPQTPQRSRILPYFIAAERGIDFSLAIFILLILLFLAVFRVPLARNVRIHATVYSVFFLSNTLVFLLRTVFGLRMKDEVDLLLMATSSGCLIAWLFLLSPKGETLPAPVRAAGPGEEQRILVHLEALNQTLLTASKKSRQQIKDIQS
jgi:hypothetical protein